MDLGIKGRVALVSGGDSGMGRESARMLLEAGVRVAITDKSGDTLRESLNDLRTAGEVIAVASDVRQVDSVNALFAEVRDRLGDPDILVNAAGVTGATGDFLDVDDAGWLETLDINLMGAVRMCRAAIPAMRQRQWGRIVLFSSEDAVQPYVDELPYCASKAGIQNLTKGLSKGVWLRQCPGQRRHARLHRNTHDRQDDGKESEGERRERRRGNRQLPGGGTPGHDPETARTRRRGSGGGRLSLLGARQLHQRRGAARGLGIGADDGALGTLPGRV